MYNDYKLDYYGDHFNLHDFNRYITQCLNSLLDQSCKWEQLQDIINQFEQLEKNKSIVYNTYIVDNIKTLNNLITVDSCINHNIADFNLIKQITTVLNFCVVSDICSR